MNESVCRFMPVKNYTGNIKTIHYVYETELNTLKQPFLHPIYYLYLVTDGSGRYRLNNEEYEIEKGCLFFSFPGMPYEIRGDVKFFYISFMGSCVKTVLENLEIDFKKPVYRNFEHIIEFWKNSVLRLNQSNANILTESVLLYTLSFINNKTETIKKNSENLFETIVDYIDKNYRDSDLSLKKVADIFSYTEKYLSYLFKKNMNINFNKYLNNLKIQYARELILNGNETTVSKIAEACGYIDSLYFSKVFKKHTGYAPTEYIKKNSVKNQ